MFPVKHVKLRARYGYGRSTECFPSLADQTSSGCGERLARKTNAFPGDGSKVECHRFRYRNVIQAVSSPSTSSTSSYQCSRPNSEKVLPDASPTFAAPDNSSTFAVAEVGGREW